MIFFLTLRLSRRHRALPLVGVLLATVPVGLTARAAEIRSHRGNLWGHPEHTLEGYDDVIKAGAQVVEIDVQLTSEGIPICLHDATLDRTTTGTGFSAGHTLAQIKGLEAGIEFPHSFPGRRVPTLEEALTFLKTRRTKVLIEPKVDAAGPIAGAIRDAEYPQDRVALLEYTPAVRGPYSAINSKWPFWLVSSGTPSSLGLAALMHLKAEGCDGLSFWPNAFSRGDYTLAHSLGLQVGVYGVDAHNVMTYVDEGADLLLTDNPGGRSDSLMTGYVTGVWDRFVTSHGLPPWLAGQGADADADGLSNLEEFAYGTDPAHSDAIPSESFPIMEMVGASYERGVTLTVTIPPQKMECLWFSVLTSSDGTTWSTPPESQVREDHTAWPADNAWRFRVAFEGRDFPDRALFRLKPHFFPRP